MNTLSSISDGRKTELELPEEIDLQVELANVGSRTLAILIDIALGSLILFIVYSLWELLAHDVAEDWFTRMSSHVLKIVLLLLVFGFQWCYFNPVTAGNLHGDKTRIIIQIVLYIYINKISCI